MRRDYHTLRGKQDIFAPREKIFCFFCWGKTPLINQYIQNLRPNNFNIFKIQEKRGSIFAPPFSLSSLVTGNDPNLTVSKPFLCGVKDKTGIAQDAFGNTPVCVGEAGKKKGVANAVKLNVNVSNPIPFETGNGFRKLDLVELGSKRCTIFVSDEKHDES